MLFWKFLFETLLLSGPPATSLSQWQLWPWPFPDHGLSQRSTTHYLACLISHQWLFHFSSFTTKRCFKRPRLVLCVPLLCRYNQNRVLSSAVAHIWGENIRRCPVRPRAPWDISSVLIFCGLAARSSSSHLSVMTTKTDTNCSQMFPKRTHCQAKRIVKLRATHRHHGHSINICWTNEYVDKTQCPAQSKLYTLNNKTQTVGKTEQGKIYLPTFSLCSELRAFFFICLLLLRPWNKDISRKFPPIFSS